MGVVDHFDVTLCRPVGDRAGIVGEGRPQDADGRGSFPSLRFRKTNGSHFGSAMNEPRHCRRVEARRQPQNGVSESETCLLRRERKCMVDRIDFRVGGAQVMVEFEALGSGANFRGGQVQAIENRAPSAGQDEMTCLRMDLPMGEPGHDAAIGAFLECHIRA